MTSLNRYDRDLHSPDGEHRIGAPSANGRIVERFERRIKEHLESHRRIREAAKR